MAILGPYNIVKFLDKVKEGKTSNLNESLHGLIWRSISKTIAIDLGLMHLGSILAVIRYNDEFLGILELIQEIKLVLCNAFISLCNFLDKQRVYHSILNVNNNYTKRRSSI